MATERKTLYSQIAEDIKLQILNGDLVPGDQLPTEFELAERYDVSRITSQRALVELEREGLIYRRQGKGSFVLSRGNTNDQGISHKVISMILPSDGPAGRRIDYINGATDYLSDNGYYLTIHTTDNDLDQERNALINLPNDGISGIIFYPTSRKNFDILYAMYLSKYPIVTIDKHFQSLPICSVVSNNFDGGYRATSHLIELGHRRIAYLSNLNIEEISTVRERFFGYCTALKKHDIAIDHNIINFALTYDGEKFAYKTIDMLKRMFNRGVTAIFAEHDYLAIAIYKTLQNEGIRIPEDISLIGFDNVEILEHVDIPLTSVDQNFYEIGREAASMIVEMIQNGYCEVPQKVIPVNMVFRNSVSEIKPREVCKVFREK
ncbi:GntR family transcriptional regulator [Xylanivirga thermophila]|uniref:GntR family transcriptional regulator n=1 Tax=Xylanivirga thermophila TaxID=2496273 RepID=UPI0013EBE65E|nr:GntR family transcriptional regulator [Xylanivirga thermophila]